MTNTLTPYIPMTGCYSEEQAEHVAACLRALRGKTDRAIVYFRISTCGLRPLQKLVDTARNAGILLTGGFELSSIHIYGHPRVNWHKMWNLPGYWDAVKSLCYEIRRATGRPDVALVHEPATNDLYDDVRTQQVDIPWATMLASYRSLSLAGVVPWIDVPVVWGPIPSDAHFDVTCARYIHLIEKAFKPLLRASRVHWMPLYHYGPLAQRAHLRVIHKGLTSPSRFHDRLACKLEPNNDYPYSVAKVHEYLAAHTGAPPVLYLTHDDAVAFAEQLEVQP